MCTMPIHAQRHIICEAYWETYGPTLVQVAFDQTLSNRPRGSEHNQRFWHGSRKL